MDEDPKSFFGDLFGWDRESRSRSNPHVQVCYLADGGLWGANDIYQAESLPGQVRGEKGACDGCRSNICGLKA